MNKQQFYYLSLKHTHREDYVFTWWKPDECGYTINLNEAGIYEDNVNHISIINKSVIAIPVESVNRWSNDYVYFHDLVRVVVNYQTSRRELGLRKDELKKVSKPSYIKNYFKTYSDIATNIKVYQELLNLFK